MILRILAVLIFITAIAGSFWLAGEQRTTHTPTTVEAAASELGYSARNVVLIETGEDGLPKYTLNADIIRQRPQDGVDFEQVRLTFRDSNGQQWHGRADRGRLDPDTGNVALAGDVHAAGLLPGSAQPIELTTATLAIDTRQNIISTTDEVLINSTQRVLKSKGMVATLPEDHLVLESNVHGTFAP